MKKIYLFLVVTLINLSAYALSGPCTPGSSGTGYSGTSSYCVGATATPITYNYAECSLTGTVSPFGVSCTATWYYNTTNTTAMSGGTVLVNSSGFTAADGVNGNLPTFTPVTATAGTYYYFCVVTW